MSIPDIQIHICISNTSISSNTIHTQSMYTSVHCTKGILYTIYAYNVHTYSKVCVQDVGKYCVNNNH